MKGLFEEFLIRCVITIRRVRKIAEIIIDGNLKDHKTFNKRLDELFTNDDNYLKMLMEDRVWIKELIDTRGMVEHEELEITNFSVTVGEDGKLNIYALSFKEKKCAVVKYMEVILYNVFSYCEDFTAMLLSLKCSDKCRIVQLPEKLWSEHRGFKYILDLKEDIKKSILEKRKTAPSLAVDGVAVTAFNNELQAPRRFVINLGNSGAPTQTVPPNLRAK